MDIASSYTSNQVKSFLRHLNNDEQHTSSATDSMGEMPGFLWVSDSKEEGRWIFAVPDFIEGGGCFSRGVAGC